MSSSSSTPIPPSLSNLTLSPHPKPQTTTNNNNDDEDDNEIQYLPYDPSKEAEYVSAIRQLISKDLSEPYSIYVYRYFLYGWGRLCFLAIDPKSSTLIGVVVSKLEPHRSGPLRGYIAMLAVRSEYRGRGIATKLVCMAIDAMVDGGADEVALETETSNLSAMRLYERLGFLRSKHLHRYYLNGNSAYRLVLYLREGVGSIPTNPANMMGGEEGEDYDDGGYGRGGGYGDDDYDGGGRRRGTGEVDVGTGMAMGMGMLGSGIAVERHVEVHRGSGGGG